MSDKINPAAVRRLAEGWANSKPDGCTCYLPTFIQNGPDEDPDTVFALGHHDDCLHLNPPGFKVVGS